MNIQLFDLRHVESALRLSTQAGWNHIDQDWKRCIALNPQTCLGGSVEQTLIATATLSRFGDLGWLGTFLVDKDHQRKGLGTRIFEAMMERARGLGVNWLAVDSSDVGRPIYKRFGFVEDEGIERWTGPGGREGWKAESGAGDADPLIESMWDGVLEFDRASVNVDRSRLLRHLAGEPGAAGRVLRDRGSVVAFGLCRPGRLAGTIGPLVARDVESAKRVFGALVADRDRIDGGGEDSLGIAVDLLDRDEFKRFLAGKGFVMRRRNIRMFQPAKLRAVLTGPNAFAAAALGMG